MRKTKQIRLAIDLAMTALLPMLMAYSLIGETFHEVIGTVILVLFLLHHIQNRKWFPALFKGRYPARRIFRTVLDLILLVLMVLQPISGILMSKHLYSFLHFPGTAAVREIHLCLAYWCYVLLCLHAGTHLVTPLKKLRNRHRRAGISLVILSAVISVYGIAAFFKRSFPTYMLHRSAFVFFDYHEPRLFFFLDYCAIMVLFAAVGCALMFLGKDRSQGG